MNRIRINVSGEIFETDLDLVKKKEFGKLMELYDETIKLGNATEVIVNRPRNTFGAILSYFLTGELHLPENACPNVFKRELEFWEVGCQKMQDCCQYKLQAFLFEEATRQKYLSKSLKDSTNSKAIIHPGTGLICRMRDKLWRLVDNADESVAAKIYFGIVFVMVLLSIIGLALSTDPSYRRRLTTCEVLDYMDLTNHPGFDDAMDYLGDPDCKDLLLLAEKYFGDEKNDKPHPRPHYQKNGETERSRDRDSVRSIPMAWYWAIITMTTVGYGDLSPSTTVGYVLATVCAISGVLLLSITLPMFVNNFLCLYLYSCVDDAMDKTETKEEEFCDDSSDILTSENSETADEMGKSTIILVKESEEGYAENKRF
ncbi:hypothetical protein ACF0H5_019852 [Mactra antiquata]